MLREVLARFGIEFDGAALQGAIAGLGTLAIAAVVAAAVLGGALLAALRDLTLEMAEFGDEVAKTARTLGLSADELLRWQFAAERSGVPAAQLANGMRRLQRNIVDAGEGTLTARRAFAAIGVDFEDAAGNAREIEDILPEIADGFAGLTSDTERSARAQQLFGRAGAQLLPFLAGGSEGIQELSDRFDELTGGSLGPFFLSAEEAQDALLDFETASIAVKATLASELLPILTTVVTKIADMVGVWNNVTQGTRPFRVVILALGIALGTLATVVTVVLLPALAPIILIFGIMAAAIAFVVLVIDDLLTLFEGGDSIIGRFLDAMFGAGAAAAVAERVRLAWASFVAFIQREAVPRLIAFGRFLVSLWPLIRPGLRALGRFIVSTFEFLQGLPARIRTFLAPIGAFFTALAARIAAFFVDVGRRFAGLRRLAAEVFGFFGIDIAGAPPSGATAPGAPGVAFQPTGPKETTVNQTVDVTITGTDLSGEELQRRVTDGIADANTRALREAERALTTVAE